MHHTQHQVGPIVAQYQISLLGDLEQMSRSVFHLLQFARSQIHERQSKEQAGGAVQLSRWFSQCLVQFSESNVFLPGGLVGQCQVQQGMARYMRLTRWGPLECRSGALQACLCLLGKELDHAP